MPFDFQPLANAERIAALSAAAILAPPPPVDFNRWAVDNIVFGQESRFPGPYDPDRFPYFAEILACAGPEHPSDTVVIAKSAQLGGTVIAQIFVAASLDLDPCQILYTHATELNATRWAKTKWKPLLRTAPALRGVLATEGSRSGSQSTLFYERKDGTGSLIIGGANSAASLSMITVKRQVQDDLSKWQMNEAGDPEGQADSRSKAHDPRKTLKIGTPMVAGECRVTKAFAGSDQRRYHVPCPHCDHFHVLEWENLLRSVDLADPRPERAHFSCPDCGGVIEQRHRAEMLRRGTWIADNPSGRYPGFHLWAAYSPLESWASIVARFVDARGDPGREQTFANDDLGRAYEQAGEAPPWKDLYDRAEQAGFPQGIVPAGALILAIGVDVQGDRLEWQLTGFGRDRHRWTIDYGVIAGSIDDETARAALDQLLKATWPDAFGNRRIADQLAIDSGYRPEEVISWARRHPGHRVMVVRGSRFETGPVIAQKPTDELTFRGRKVKTGVRPWWLNVSQLKAGLYADLAKADPQARGHVAFCAGLGETFFRGLTAEKRVKATDARGFAVWYWRKEETQRNEPLDTANYAEAAALRCKWARLTPAEWDALAARLEVAPAPSQAELFEAGPAALATGPTVPAGTDQPVIPVAGAAPIGAVEVVDEPPASAPVSPLAARVEQARRDRGGFIRRPSWDRS